MYAVIQTGGKQYRVQQGDVLRIEKLAAEEGSTVEFEKVVLLGEGENVRIGTPFLDGGRVTGRVRTHGRGSKIDVIKFKRRKKYRRQYGHRQPFTEVEITDLGSAGKSSGKSAKAAAPEDAGAGKSTSTRSTSSRSGSGKSASSRSTSSRSTGAKAGSGKSTASKSSTGKSSTGKSTSSRSASGKASSGSKSTGKSSSTGSGSKKSGSGGKQGGPDSDQSS